MPRWLILVGRPDPRLGRYLLLFLVQMTVLVVLHRAGVETGTIISWLVVVGVLADQTLRRLFGAEQDPGGAASASVKR